MRVSSLIESLVVLPRLVSNAVLGYRFRLVSNAVLGYRFLYKCAWKEASNKCALNETQAEV